MKLSDYQKAYYEFSGKASDVARQLAFAGIALIWIFRVERPQAPRLPEQLLLPSALLVLALGADLLHYIVKTIIWGRFCRKEEKKLKLSLNPCAYRDEGRGTPNLYSKAIRAPQH